MNVYRRVAPAFAFVLIAGLLLLLARSLRAEVWGGLPTLAAYALALQVVTALFLVAVIDVLQGLRMLRADTVFDTGRTVWRYYRATFAPTLFLAFGLGTSLASLAIGIFEQRDVDLGGLASVRTSDLVLGGLLFLGTLVQLRQVHGGFFGWSVGVAVGCVIAQVVLAPLASDEPTLVWWVGFGLALCALGAAARGLSRWRRSKLKIGWG